jgi:hypothetical protein
VSAPLEVGLALPIRLELEDSGGARRDVHVVVEVRSCRPGADGWTVGTRIVELEPQARVALMEWCYVVCSHEEVRGARPGALATPERLRQAPLVPQPAAHLEPVSIDAAA